MNSTGSWTLHYDWGVKGVFCVAQIYFNFDGTFGYLGGANEGTWTEVDGTIILRFKQTTDKDVNTVYSGQISRDVMSGAMFSSAGEKGQWYAVKKGAKLYLNKDNPKLPYLQDKQAIIKYDPTGKPV